MQISWRSFASILALVSICGAFSTTKASIEWVRCPRGIPSRLACGEITVPLAYKSGSSIQPLDNRTITLGLTRLNATGRSIRGPLFVNPGGPGGATRGLIAEGLQEPEFRFNKNVMEMYDLIGLDPRGVGTSTPVKCNPKIFNRRVQTLINSTKTYEAAKRYGQDLGESCASLTGPLIDHLDTIHVAKDHEVVRRALGAEQFDFLGLSYGSMIGSTYLELFPNEAGRMVFDGIVDHSQSEISTLFSEATTFEATLNQFFKWCDSQDDCALKAGINDTKVVFGQITRNASLSPLPAPACNNACQPNVTFEDLMIAVQSSLVSFPEGWVDLATSLAMAARGNASAISASLMTSETPDPDGFSPYASIAIGCQDWKHSGTTEQDLIQRLEAVKPFVPITKGVTQSWYYQSMCIGWPTNTTFPQQPLDRVMVETAPPVLLVNSVFDPECSIVWANGVREQLPTAVSITRNGTGHTSHVMLGDTRDAIDAFFATGKLPRDGSIYQS